MSSGSAVVLIALFLLVLPGKARAADLTVAAAADVAAIERPITDSFASSYPGNHVRFVFAASGALAQQIANGAPYDVFLSADEGFVDELARTRKILPDSVEVYAQGQVGILWRDRKIHNLKDLEADWVRFVALPNPQLAPYGVAAEQTLAHAGVKALIKDKIVFGENVRQALQLFDSGNADVVITAYSLIAGRPGAAVIPAAWHQPILQKAGIVAESNDVELARKFLKLLSSPVGAAILRAHGFESVAPH